MSKTLLFSITLTSPGNLLLDKYALSDRYPWEQSIVIIAYTRAALKQYIWTILAVISA